MILVSSSKLGYAAIPWRIMGALSHGTNGHVPSEAVCVENGHDASVDGVSWRSWPGSVSSCLSHAHNLYPQLGRFL
jgi:hypothetical protein